MSARARGEAAGAHEGSPHRAGRGGDSDRAARRGARRHAARAHGRAGEARNRHGESHGAGSRRILSNPQVSPSRGARANVSSPSARRRAPRRGRGRLHSARPPKPWLPRCCPRVPPLCRAAWCRAALRRVPRRAAPPSPSAPRLIARCGARCAHCRAPSGDIASPNPGTTSVNITHSLLCRLPVTVAPKWLDGTLVGDAGFDPLGLGERLRQNAQRSDPSLGLRPRILARAAQACARTASSGTWRRRRPTAAGYAPRCSCATGLHLLCTQLLCLALGCLLHLGPLRRARPIARCLSHITTHATLFRARCWLQRLARRPAAVTDAQARRPWLRWRVSWQRTCWACPSGTRPAPSSTASRPSRCWPSWRPSWASWRPSAWRASWPPARAASWTPSPSTR